MSKCTILSSCLNIIIIFRYLALNFDILQQNVFLCVWNTLYSWLSPMNSTVGQGGLEVCRNGARQIIPLDLRVSRIHRLGRNYTTGADLVRRSHPHWFTALRNRPHHCHTSRASEELMPRVKHIYKTHVYTQQPITYNRLLCIYVCFVILHRHRRQAKRINVRKTEASLGLRLLHECMSFDFTPSNDMHSCKSSICAAIANGRFLLF